MNLMKMAMKVREDKCHGSGLMLNMNKKQKSIPNISYSMMYVLEYGFSIMMYSFTHVTEMWYGCVHRKFVVRLILAKGMTAIWHESSYHSSAKSRQTPSGLFKDDLRLVIIFSPLLKSLRNINVGTADGVAREFGEYLHRNFLDLHMYKYFYDEECACVHYMEGKTVIDFKDVPTTSYNKVG